MDAGTIVHAKLIRIQEDTNGFIYYIFENLEPSDWKNKYFMMTRYPNWEHRFLKEGEKGFVVYTECLSGQKYFNVKTQKPDTIQNSHIRFEKFIDEEKEEDNSKYVI